LSLVSILAAAAALAATSPQAGQGRATVECRVTTERRVADCVLISESPTGAGVGAFALRLVKAYRIPPNDRRVRNGRIVIPMKFKLP
jgi:TonB family protein